MSTRKLKSTFLNECCDICTRVSDLPLLSPSDITPSDPRLEIIGVLNPTFLNIGGRRQLIVRVDERPLNFSKRNSIKDDAQSILIPRVNVEDECQLELYEVEVPGGYDPNKEPILPDSVRQDTQRPDLLISYISHLRIVDLSNDQAKVSEKPIAYPNHQINQFGCEDPRATLIEGKPVVTYNAVSRFGATAWFARLSDHGTFEHNAMLLGPDHKHTALFPKKIGDYYYMLTRPLARTYIQSSGIWLFKSPDLVHWGSPSPLLLPRFGMWDSERVGPCTCPILISAGWLFLYYGVGKDDSYLVGATLLDIKKPENVIARSIVPILVPTLDWEKNGRRADTVFPCGIELLNSTKTIRIYYGASDTHIGVAEVTLTDLLNTLS